MSIILGFITGVAIVLLFMVLPFYLGYWNGKRKGRVSSESAHSVKK